MPDYPLPNQNITQIGQTASNVPPNILSGVGPGVAQGFGMGLQQRQVQALEQERQTQLMSAQLAAQQAKKENDLKALDTLSTQYERLSKNHPDTAFEFYRDKMAPFYSSVLQDHGIQADFQSEANPLHETSDSVKRINDAVTGLADGSIDQPTFEKIMSREQSGHNVGEYLQKRIDEAQKAGNTVQDYTKHQDELVQQERQRQDSLRSDPVIQQVEMKRVAAGQVYDALRHAQDESGNYNVSQGQLVDLYGNIYRAQTGVGITGEALPMMDQPTAQANYAKLAAYFGLSKNALPKELGDRLLSMSNQLGNFNEAQHQKMMEGRNTPVVGLDEKHRDSLSNLNSRGFSFQEMKANADKASKYQPNKPKTQWSADKEKRYQEWKAKQ